MANIVLCVAAVLVLSGQFAPADRIPSLPARDGKINEQVWIDYSRKVLKILFPTRLKLVDKVAVEVVQGDNVVNAATSLRRIVVFTGMIRTVADEQEYAAVLAHEFGHIARYHRYDVHLPASLQELSLYGGLVYNWPVIRSNELEADFFGYLSSPQPGAVLKILERSVPTTVESVLKSPLGFRMSTADVLMLRHNSLQNISEVRTPIRIGPATALPVLPGKKAGLREWQLYTLEVLHAMYPAHSGVVDRVDVRVLPDSSDLRIEGSGTRGTIYFNLALMKSVIRSKEDFAVMMGHEFGHMLYGRTYGKDRLNTTLSYDMNVDIARKEAEADMVGTLPIIKGECYLARSLEGIINSPLVRPDKDVELMNRERILRLRAMCALNY